MKVTISEVGDPKEALLALGLETWPYDIGVIADLPEDLGQNVMHAGRHRGVIAPEPETPALPAPAEPVKTAKAKQVKARRTAKAAAEEPAPRITIRSRILDALRSGPKTARQIENTLQLGGVNIAQHLYLIGRDKLASRDGDTDLWTLVK